LPAPAPRRNSTRRVRFWREHKDVLVHTHIAENKREIAWNRRTISRRQKFISTSTIRHGLIGRRAVLAHGVHLSEDDSAAATRAAPPLAHCPTSNLFLGSGLFGIGAAKDPRRPVHVGLGTDYRWGHEFFRCSPPWGAA